MLRQGFTLIELLVVVVIMGILSATMMPAFMSTVEKSRAGEGLSNAASLAQGIDAYLSKGELFTKTTNMGEFLNMPGQKQSDSRWHTPNFRYYAYCTTSACYVKVTRLTTDNFKYGFIYSKSQKNNSFQDRSWTKKCYEFGTDVGHKICSGMEKGWSVNAADFSS